MRSLVVLSHPEPASFAAALARTAADALDATLVDLYAEGFDPRLSAADFTQRVEPGRLRPMEEQEHAARTGTFDPELAAHIDRFREADLLVMVQPFWWFSLPAMAKGWIDRVFVNGYAYEYPGTPAWTGPLNGKRALAIFTSSYERDDFAGGRAGNVEAILYPLLWGTFAYTGMQVLEPYIAYGADSVDEPTRCGYLEALRARLANIGDEAPLELGPR